MLVNKNISVQSHVANVDKTLFAAIFLYTFCKEGMLISGKKDFPKIGELRLGISPTLVLAGLVGSSVLGAGKTIKMQIRLVSRTKIGKSCLYSLISML